MLGPMQLLKPASTLLALATLSLACSVNEPTDGYDAMPEQVRIGDIDWYVDYDAAVDVAREADKALWVHFGEDPG